MYRIQDNALGKILIVPTEIWVGKVSKEPMLFDTAVEAEEYLRLFSLFLGEKFPDRIYNRDDYTILEV